MTITAKHRGARRLPDLGQAATSARRGLLVAASSGIVITMAATTASAAPENAPAGRPEAGQAKISDAARTALSTAPAVVVDADAVWSVDDVVEGVSIAAVVGTAAVDAAPETSRDNAREAAPVAASSVQALSEKGYTTSTLNVRSGPSTDHGRIGSVNGYRTFDITGKANGWYRIAYNGGEGWVSGSYTKLGTAPEAPAASSSASTASAPASSSGFGASVVAIARQYIGTPYVYGGTTPSGFDCSGFTSYVFGKMGVSIPSSSAAQYGVGTQVSAANAQPGDLMWWPGHVGIYTGNGNHIAARNPGTPLSETPIYRSGAVYFRLG